MKRQRCWHSCSAPALDIFLRVFSRFRICCLYIITKNNPTGATHVSLVSASKMMALLSLHVLQTSMFIQDNSIGFFRCSSSSSGENVRELIDLLPTLFIDASFMRDVFSGSLIMNMYIYNYKLTHCPLSGLQSGSCERPVLFQ